MAALGFTPASGQDVFSIETTEQPSSTTSCVISGKEARQFYENLMKDDRGQEASRSTVGKRDHGRKQQSNRESNRRARRRARAAEVQQGQTESAVQRGITGDGEGDHRRETSNSERSTELLGLRLLRCAHGGDISGLKDLLSKGVDINFQVQDLLLSGLWKYFIFICFNSCWYSLKDTYFWTAMMCASWSGQRAAVRLLLQHGAAWVGVVDTQGRDARDLALEGISTQLLALNYYVCVYSEFELIHIYCFPPAGHNDVFEEFESYGRCTETETPSDNR